MGICIYRETSFRKSLDTLAKGDKTAFQAAFRTEEIMASLSFGDSQTIEVVSRRTKNGELPIKGIYRKWLMKSNFLSDNPV